MDPIIGNHYKILDQIGKGSFGEIFKGVDVNTDEEVAVKMEPNFTKSPQIQLEARVYKLLANGIGVPNVYCYGFNKTHNFLVMELLGKSLEDLFHLCDKKFSLKTVLMLADQMISCIEFIHSKNLIYRDIKPDNFMMGANQNSNIVYLIDYGLTKNYRDPRTHVHEPYTDNNKLTGNARYASVNALSGVEQSRRDDLESLGYVWAYFLKGSLPWIGIDAEEKKKNKSKLICDVKKKTSFQELFSGCPIEFVHYMFSVQQLRFADQPNYSSLRSLFRQVFIDNGFVYDYVYDWNEKIPVFNIEKVPKPILQKPLTRIENQPISDFPITEDDLFPLPRAPLYIEPQRKLKSKTKPTSQRISRTPKPSEKRNINNITKIIQTSSTPRKNLHS